MKKKTIANIVMVFIIFAIALSGILYVGHIKGWFDKQDENVAVLTEIRGIVTLERDGVAYTVTKDTVLRKDDKITCDIGSTAKIHIGDEYIMLSHECSVIIVNAEVADFSMEEKSENVLADAEDMVTTEVDAEVSTDDGTTQKEDTTTQDTITEDTTTENVATEQTVETEEIATEQTTEAEEVTTEESTTEQTTTTEETITEDVTTEEVTTEEETLTCTITIVCDTILNNWESLDPAKAAYVPSNGCILSAATIEFSEGETVFDVLEKACSTYGIQLEYSWTPMYDSYYIEGINNLYEFDCGAESGWMYKVDGWFPDYGCSSYELTGGENIVWCYTCVGLGADVGGGNW